MLKFLNKIAFAVSNVMNFFDNKHFDYNNRIHNRNKSIELIKYKEGQKGSNDNKKIKGFKTKSGPQYEKTGVELPRTYSTIRKIR